MTGKIVFTIPLEERHLKVFREICPGAELIPMSRETVTREQAQEAEVIIGNIKPSLIQGSTALRWLQLDSAGTDGYTAPGVIPEGALLTNATGAYGLAISEYMIGTLLVLMKRLNEYQDLQRQHLWKKLGHVTSIEGSRTLVVGLGNIGGDFARKMNALGSKVTGIRRTLCEKPDYLEALYQMDHLKECVKDADVVAAVLPGTPETYHVFNEEIFSAMKEGAIFLNVGRGTAADPRALCDALNSGHLYGAAVDVTEPEPLPADDPLWDAKNILITPHTSGHYYLPETLERIIRISQENLRRYCAGEELDNLVNFTTGYRDNERYR